MAIFAAVGNLIELVSNMTKTRNENKIASDSNTNTTSNNTGGGNKNNATCLPPPPKSSSNQPTSSGQDDTDPGLGIDIDELLPDINLNEDEEEELENEPGKSFLELLFGFILDPITAIIKGIIKVVELAIVTVNVVTHLNKCAKWFVIYVFCTLIYIPISMLFALLNLSTLEKKIWKILYSVDAALYCIIEKVRGKGQGFHIAKYSDDIREVCFLETVKPTDCSSKGGKKKSKKGGLNVSKLLSSQFFLFLVILCIFSLLFIFGSKNGGIQTIPYSFWIVFGVVVLAMIYIIASIFTSYFLYLFIILVIPIVLFMLSFIFGYIPTNILFPKFYSEGYMSYDITNDNKTYYKFTKNDTDYEKHPLIRTIQYYFRLFIIGLSMFFTSTMNHIKPLPNIMKYIIASISFFIIVIIITIIIALSIAKPDPNDTSTTAGATTAVQSAFQFII